VGRLDARLEIRVDKQMLYQLERRAEAQSETVASLVRQALEVYLASGVRASASDSLEAAISLCTPVPPDPAVLVRRLERTHEVQPHPGPGNSFED
jgi:hypothetical protein